MPTLTFATPDQNAINAQQGFASPPTGYGGSYTAPAPNPGGYSAGGAAYNGAGGATGGYGGTGGGGYGGAPGYDPNPDMGPQMYTNSIGETYDAGGTRGGARYADNPNVAPLLGTSWEPTAEMLDKTQTGDENRAAWYPNMVDFMYGRDPNAANRDIARMQGMGAEAAGMGVAWGQAGANYALGQARDMNDLANQATGYGLQSADAVRAAGQNQMGVANQSAATLQGVGNQAAATGAALGSGIAKTGQGYGAALAGAGSGALGSAAADAGRMNAIGQRYGQELTTAGRDIAAAGTGRANTLAALEQTQGPSGAQGLLNQQNNRAMNNQLALARSGRGMGGSAAAMAQAGQNIGALQQDAGNQAAQLKAQEYAAWRQRQGQNLTNAGQMDIGARTSGANVVNLGQGAEAGAAAGAGQLMQGANSQNIQALGAGGSIANQANIAGGGLTMQGQGMMQGAYGQAAGIQNQGAAAGTAAQAAAAGIGQGAYGQGLAGYGQAAGVGMGGYQYGSDTQLAALQQQQAYEQYALGIRELEQKGGLALEDKYIRDYAIREDSEANKRANEPNYVEKVFDSTSNWLSNY